jgi:hydroxypyruvate reductase
MRPRTSLNIFKRHWKKAPSLEIRVLPAQTVLLSGGEATVIVRGDGRGGPNAEYALALARALKGRAGVWAMACDTDGIDGTEDNAGALIAPDTLVRALSVGEDAGARLENNDAYGFFTALGDLVMTGPTMTNVNDFRAIVVGADAYTKERY